MEEPGFETRLSNSEFVFLNHKTLSASRISALEAFAEGMG